VPNQINPNFIAKAKASEHEWTRKSGFVDSMKVPFHPAKAPSRNTVFQEFEYIPSLYTLADELRAEERKVDTEKQQVSEPVCAPSPCCMGSAGGAQLYTWARGGSDCVLAAIRVQRHAGKTEARGRVWFVCEGRYDAGAERSSPVRSPLHARDICHHAHAFLAPTRV
jgi:hypothetical protein